MRKARSTSFSPCRRAEIGWCSELGAYYCNDIAAADSIINAWTLTDTKTAAKTEIKALAKQVREDATGAHASAEQATWATKAIEAQTYLQWEDAGAVLATKPDTPNVTIEAQVSGAHRA